MSHQRPFISHASFTSLLFCCHCGTPPHVNPLMPSGLEKPPAEILRTIGGNDNSANETDIPTADPARNDANPSPIGDIAGEQASTSENVLGNDFEVTWLGEYSPRGPKTQNHYLSALEAPSCPIAASSTVATIERPGRLRLAANTVVIISLTSGDRAASIAMNSIQGRGPKGVCFLADGNQTLLRAAINVSTEEIYVSAVGARSSLSIRIAENQTVGSITGDLKGDDSHLFVGGDGTFRCNLIRLLGNETTADCPQP